MPRPRLPRRLSDFLNGYRAGRRAQAATALPIELRVAQARDRVAGVTRDLSEIQAELMRQRGDSLD